MRSKIKSGRKNAAIRVFAVTEQRALHLQPRRRLKISSLQSKKQIIYASFHLFQRKFYARGLLTGT